jgi:nucleoside-diphosphate-sugar epimerase
MRILVLGGTQFLSRELASQAVSAGHDVTVAARGITGKIPVGAEHVAVDRSVAGGLSPLSDRSFDAVVDVGRRPSWSREAVATLGPRASHWTYVSSISVYADEATPGQTATAPLREAASEDADESNPELYGELKVASERAVLDVLADRAFVCRPGLIVGPGDPTGRFTYWPQRLAAGGEVLAPGSPDDLVQLIDVRDLAGWLLGSLETGRTGVLDVVSAPFGRGELLAAVGRGVDVEPQLTWVPQEFLVAHEVAPWAGPRSMPMWLPLPEYAGSMAHDTSAALHAGLEPRPVEETTRDTLAWLAATPDAVVGGLSRSEEAQVLAAWHA